MDAEIPKLLDSLVDRLWKRRALYPLWRFLSAYYSVNGLTDGWSLCYDTLKDCRALCRDKLSPEELQDLNLLINKIGQMLQKLETIGEIQQDIVKTFRKEEN